MIIRRQQNVILCIVKTNVCVQVHSCDSTRNRRAEGLRLLLGDPRECDGTATGREIMQRQRPRETDERAKESERHKKERERKRGRSGSRLT